MDHVSFDTEMKTFKVGQSCGLSLYLLKNRHRLFSDPRVDFDVADL